MEKKKINGYIIAYLAIAILFLLIKPWVFSSNWVTSHDFHSLLEIVQTFIAIGVGVISIMYFLVWNNLFYLLIGLGFSTAAGNDLIHGILSYVPLLADVNVDLSRFMPATYVLGKCCLASIIIAAPLLENLKPDIKKKGIKPAVIFSVSVFIASGSLTALAFFISLPQFIYPEKLISRPVDFFSAILFAIAFGLVFKRFLAKRDIFSGLILTSIMFNCGGQIYVSFSKQLFDPLFNLAHIAHFFSYVMPLVAIPMQGLADLNLARHEISRRKQAEEELKKYQDYLEQLVHERTADLKNANEQLTKQVYTRMQAQKKLRDAYKALKKTHNQIKKSQNQLIQSEKMNALGTMFAGLAHEMNNPMMSILNYTQHCIKHTPKDDINYNTLEDIQNETKRCINIIKNLLTFSRMEEEGEEGYQQTSCPRLLEKVLELMSYRIDNQGVTIQKNIAEDLPEIRIKKNNIQQVFFNLIQNALDAVKGQEKQEIIISISSKDECMNMTIADNGCGIALENLTKVFDPFFTTKPPGEGTGLGLSICHNILTNHKGQMDCESKVGLGTKIRILLPLEKPKEDGKYEQKYFNN